MTRSIEFNKYWVYFPLICLLLGLTIGPRIMKAINYSTTQGVVRHFRYFENKGSRRSRTTWYPLVDFKVNDVQYSCYGSKYQHEELFMNDKVTVLFNKEDPTDAYVYSALGFWAPTLVYLVPLVLVISLLFGLDYIPKKISLKIK